MLEPTAVDDSDAPAPASTHVFPRWSAAAALAAGVIGLPAGLVELTGRQLDPYFVAPLLALALLGVYRGLAGRQRVAGAFGLILTLVTLAAAAVVLWDRVSQKGVGFMLVPGGSSVEWVDATETTSWVTLTFAWALLGLAHLLARRLQGFGRAAILVAALPLMAPYFAIWFSGFTFPVWYGLLLGVTWLAFGGFLWTVRASEDR